MSEHTRVNDEYFVADTEVSYNYPLHALTKITAWMSNHTHCLSLM